ncbi:MAG: winged helix-turn-helix domain-containing protein [Desulfovibrionaceae bacterium]
MKRPQIPTVRVHLWLENGEDCVLGPGRILLLDLIEEHGSLRKAAKSIGMSYRAAWGKLRATEKALGVKLVEPSGSKRDGCQLTVQGRQFRRMFWQWFQGVEQIALERAESIFPWTVRPYVEPEAPAARSGPGPDAPQAVLARPEPA